MQIKQGLGALVFLASTSSSAAVLNPDQWRYATDPHGSKAIYSTPLVKGNEIEIAFSRVPRVDAKNNSWVELIHDLPGQTLEGISGFTLTYQSDKPLVVKLSQKEYGGNGDNSYAHYQVVLPSSLDWHTQAVVFEDFSRPSWTPGWSQDKGIIKSSVSALYFVPDLTDEKGGDAWIKIKQVSLQ